jgi:hypothetical protein
MKRRHSQLASDLRRSSVLLSCLSAWLGHARRLCQLRAAAVTTIEQALFGGREQLTRMCLRAWRHAAERRRQLRSAARLLARLQRFNLLSTAMQGWEACLHSPNSPTLKYEPHH